MPPRAIGEALETLLAIGGWNEYGMPSSYWEKAIYRVSEGIYLRTEGDVDEQMSADYVRGDLFELVVSQAHWVDGDSTVPGILLADYYGLLTHIEGLGSGYPATLFNSNPGGVSDGEFFDVNINLESGLRDRLVAHLERLGCTWPRNAALGHGPDFEAWQSRIRTWQAQK